MKKKYVVYDTFISLYCLLIVLWVVAVLIKAYRAPGNQILYRAPAYFDCSAGWYDDRGNILDIDDLTFSKSEVGKERILHYQIPSDYNLCENQAICFFSRGMDFDVYAQSFNCNSSDSENFNRFEPRKIYEFRQNAARLSGEDIGLTAQIVPLHCSDKESEITLVITPAEYSAFILDMRIQKSTDFLLSVLRPRLSLFVASLVIFFFGIAILVYTFFAIKREREGKIAMYAWGLFSLIIGTMLVIQSQVLQILTGKPEFFTTLKYALALLLCFPLSVLIDYIPRVGHKHFSFAIGIIVALLMVFETAGNFFMNISFYRLFYLSALIMLYIFAMSIYLLIRECRYSLKNHKKLNTVGMLSLMVALEVFAIIDLSIYYASKRHMTDWGRWLRNAYLVYILIVLVIALRISIKRNKKAQLADKYKADSLTDAMTGLYNKGAYIEREEELTQKLIKQREKGNNDFSFVIMSLDLNNLKKVNDSMGHEAGDIFIQKASKLLKNAVGDNGEVFRVGGDEFLALIFGKDLEIIYEHIINKLNKDIEDFNNKEKSLIPLTFAYGHAICRADQNQSIHDSERMADKEMYACKHKMKMERE
ncbi:MAG: diguanylate cyclase [Treponema sp.]|nr:diguanylate cyclase [Treponema sp.]